MTVPVSMWHLRFVCIQTTYIAPEPKHYVPAEGTVRLRSWILNQNICCQLSVSYLFIKSVVNVVITDAGTGIMGGNIIGQVLKPVMLIEKLKMFGPVSKKFSCDKKPSVIRIAVKKIYCSNCGKKNLLFK